MENRQLQESIDKRNAAVMELERKYRIAVAALDAIADYSLGSTIQPVQRARDALRELGLIK